MANDTDKPDKPLDDNETLLKALESIKSLLATSETKLSQARESINQASAHSLKMTRDIPVLDDIVVPGKTIEPAEAAQAETPPSPADRPKTEKPASKQADLAEYRDKLEQEMRDRLRAYANELENELNAKIRDFIDKKPSD